MGNGPIFLLKNEPRYPCAGRSFILDYSWGLDDVMLMGVSISIEMVTWGFLSGLTTSFLGKNILVIGDRLVFPDRSFHKRRRT
jgi:hypothetical protein